MTGKAPAGGGPGSDPPPFDLDLLRDEEIGTWDDVLGPDDPHSLAELINRVLDRGVVITGHVTLSVAGVDLVYLGLNAILTSVSTARQHLRTPLGPHRADEPEP